MNNIHVQDTNINNIFTIKLGFGFYFTYNYYYKSFNNKLVFHLIYLIFTNLIRQKKKIKQHNKFISIVNYHTQS